jgi:hypothetical protein
MFPGKLNSSQFKIGIDSYCREIVWAANRMGIVWETVRVDGPLKSFQREQNPRG